MTVRTPHVIAAGSFGIAVAERLEAAIEAATIQHVHGDRPIPMTWPVAGIYVLAASREMPALAGVLDDCAFRWRVPWLPVVYEHPHLRIGPLVVPGRGPCYHCFRGRLAQHGTAPELTQALERHLGADDPGPGGFLPAHATFAAGAAQATLAALRDDEGEDVGRVRWLNVVTARPGSARVTSVHGCVRCGRRREERLRSFAWLEDDLATLAASPEPTR